MLDPSKLRICYLAGTLGRGGAEQQLFYALRSLCQSGAEVRVLCLERGAWEEPIRGLGVPVEWVGQSRSRLRRLARIVKALRSFKPDIVQSQHFYTNAYASVAGRLSGCAEIGALRSDGRFEFLGCGAFGGRLNLRLPRVLAANSRCAIQYALDRGVPPSRPCFLPNAVDTERFHPVTETSPPPPVLLAVGCLTWEKRFDRFLSILHCLREVYHLEVRGVLAGPTAPGQDLRPQLERQAAALGLRPDGVELLGSVSDMSALYQRAAVCISTSDHEGTPNVLLEAMASGLPIVATRVGGVPDIVQHGQTGFLLAPEDLGGMANAINELVSKPELRATMGARARAFVQETHSLRGLHEHLCRLHAKALLRPAAGFGAQPGGSTIICHSHFDLAASSAFLVESNTVNKYDDRE